MESKSKAERREYVLVGDDHPMHRSRSYRDEERVYPRNDRYELAQDDRYVTEREPRRVLVEDREEQVRGREYQRESLLTSDNRKDEIAIQPHKAVIEQSRDSDAGMTSKTWFSTLEDPGPSMMDKVRNSVYNLYLAATGQSALLSRQEGIDDARTLAKFADQSHTVSAPEDASQLKFTSAKTEAAQPGDAATNKLAVEAVEEKASASSVADSETDTDTSNDSEKLKELAKQVNEMAAQAEKNQESIQADAKTAPADKTVEISALGQQVQGIESVNAENQQAVDATNLAQTKSQAVSQSRSKTQSKQNHWKH
jgi:hypothetical protein